MPDGPEDRTIGLGVIVIGKVRNVMSSSWDESFNGIVNGPQAESCDLHQTE
jgi:hypothetical protein